MAFAIASGAALAGAQAGSDAASGTAAASTGASTTNTRLNTRDKNNTADTPQAQSNSKADRDLLAAVRRTVVKDKSLSTLAHNVKIMVANGAVTLRGPVHDDAEKSKIETLAKQVNGVASVENDLDIKTN
ncbi:BON domain-containing protein [Rugamonas sp.]|uniref:BON domain-containing protein n=1 Tax=Rugamonas sp. TaxID=1926287 RepID=UPI0025F6BE0A|nr:BON domain-containing protein [Rugamonas sp.]